jgi:TonB family protein
VLGIALGIALLFSLIFFVTLKLPIGRPLSTAPLETPHTPRAIAVTVPKLWADYRANQVAADDRYKGKRLVVEGQVASVNKGTTDDAYVLLSTFDASEPIHADIKAEYQAEATTLRTGQIITVDCDGAGLTMGVLFLMSCSIQPNADVEQSLSQPHSGPQPEPQPQAAPRSAVQEVNAKSNARENSSAAETHVALPTLVYAAPAAYSAEARRNKLEGTVQIRLVVDEKGNPQNVTVVRSLGMGLDESAVEAVKHYKFNPAVDESTGRAVTARMNISLQFHLN